MPSTDARLCLVGDDDIDNDGQPNRDDDDDGFEFFSARDLNGSGLPFPGKRPCPGGLDKEDAGIDHDSDGLSLRDESRPGSSRARRCR